MKTLASRFALPIFLLFAGTVHGGETGHAREPEIGARYHVSKLPSLGGSSVAFSINDRGWAVGRSTNADGTRNATLWRNGILTNLGTLGGPDKNSVVRWQVKNVVGIVTGIAQTDEADPNNEDWSCSAFFGGVNRKGFRCVGFRWRNGVMKALPTLGGTHGFAAGTNNWGYTVGWAENLVRDPTCVAPQKLQFRPVVWSPKDGHIRELPLPAGDTAGAATAINDRGQIVGISGICDQAIGRETARRAVLWERGEVKDIGNLGGLAWHTPNAINARGDIVGFGNYDPADGINYKPHAFLKRPGRSIQDLGTLQKEPGAYSEAWGINEWRQVVGRSCDADNACLAFLWRNGTMVDLQTLAVSGDPLVFIAAYDIDNFGRISGQAFDPASGQFVAYVAIPVRDRRLR
jgi:probable HAF family extracellular repeat protein